MSTTDELKRKKRDLLLQKKQLKEGLPHLYKFNDYAWSRDFKTTTNRMRLLTAANQVSKSSTLISDMIEKAGNPECWEKFFWLRKPKLFWYIYPDKVTLKDEFLTKWVGEFLPQGDYKNHPTYGWREEWDKGYPYAIHFNSGVSLIFKTWKMDLQASTVDYVGCDEELPKEIYDELSWRISATDGMFAAVFTATKSQYFWYEAMELKGKKERFPDAWKKTISLYDCMEYVDGSPTPWTKDRIQQRVNQCSDEHEIQRRIHGRFILSRNALVFSSFRRERNLIEPEDIPDTWLWYSGIDVGSGGNNHPPAIVFVAVRPDYKEAHVPLVWRGDDGPDYSNGDILEKYIKLRNKIPHQNINGEFYDWQAKDLEIQATRIGLPLQKAEKGHEIGEGLMNTAFKNMMLLIHDTEANRDLADELMSLRTDVSKTKAKDDLCDALRYAFSKIPMDYSGISGEKIVSLPPKKLQVHSTERERGYEPEINEDVWDPTYEIEMFNELLEP